MIVSKTFLQKLHEETLVQRLLNDKVLLIDSSEFSYWQGCFAKGLFYGGVRRVPVEGQTALLFGQALHEGLAARILGEPDDVCINAVRGWATSVKLDSYLDPKRTTAKACEMMEAYIHDEDIKNRRIIPLELNGVKMVEKTFTSKLGRIDTNFGIITVLWCGKIDVIDYESNVLWITDHKTTSMMGPKFVDDKVRSDQIMGYVREGRRIAAELELNKPVEGARINALCHRSSGYEFQRFPIPISEWKIREWEEETLERCEHIVEQLYKLLTLSPVVVPNRQTCVTKYGKCPFFDLCELPTVARERTLFDNAFYRHNEWNPTKA